MLLECSVTQSPSRHRAGLGADPSACLSVLSQHCCPAAGYDLCQQSGACSTPKFPEGQMSQAN